MNTSQIRIKEKNSENSRSSSGCCVESLSSEKLNSQPQFSELQKNSTAKLNLGQCNLSGSSISSHFCMPLSAVYATKQCMSVPKHKASVVDSSEESNINIESEDSLQSFIQSSCGSYNSKVSSDKSFAIPSNMPKEKLFLFLKSLSAVQNGTTTPRQPYIASERYQDRHGIEKQPPCHSKGISTVYNSTNESRTSNAAVMISSKFRMRWTAELHERFVECVERPRGAEKEILKLMNNDTLTIFHVKSHLQKYRASKHIPNLKTEGSAGADFMSVFDAKTVKEIAEALKVHINVQETLNEQLEIQKNLQLQIEEQGEQLKMMLEHQLKANMDFSGYAKTPNQPSFQKDS